MEPKTTGKRIVSKGKYATALIEYVGTGSIGGLYLAVSVISTLALLWCVWMCVFVATHEAFTFEFVRTCVGLLVLLTSLIYFSGKWGINLLKEAKTMPVGIPLTRANTAYLPAPDTLVRASVEPLQEQQSTLLRAAGDAQETPSEQLVRAVNGAIAQAVNDLSTRAFRQPVCDRKP